jgi:general L-amino acid transport system permease protein
MPVAQEAVRRAAPPRPPAFGVVAWARENLFSSWGNALVTLGILYLLWRVLPPFFEWAVLNAVWQTDDPRVCHAARGEGACWAFVTEKYRFILFGVYPYEEHWRPALATLVLIGLWIVSAMRRFWTWSLPLIWVAGLTVIGALMWGGVLELAFVENERWGGLILTLLLFSFGVAFAFPLAILLALARRSDMPAIKALAVAFIELIRGVPLISLLFMASVMLPLFLPTGVWIDKLLRAQIALILFASAYLAEVIRGGLQAIPSGQYEAADALGLPYWKKTLLIVLPQALRISIPPLVNSFIGFFKDTSLVLIIGLFDLLSTVKIALTEPAWIGFGVEAYLFASAVYFVFCYAMSRYSQGLERELARAEEGRRR